jgi:hypothetical protein
LVTQGNKTLSATALANEWCGKKRHPRRPGWSFFRAAVDKKSVDECPLKKGTAICREGEAMEKTRVPCSVPIYRWCAAKSRVITSALHFFTVRKTRLLYHMILTLFSYAPFYENPDY